MLKICVPFAMIQQSRTGDEWYTLCYWAWLRDRYQKKVFYNYTCKSIARELKVAPGTAHHHIKRMIELGWAKTKDGHLFLVPLHKFTKSSIIRLQVFAKRSEQIAALKSVYLINNLLHQGKKIIKKTEAVRMACTRSGKVTKNQMKTITRAGGVAKLEMSINNRTTLSNRKIGVLFRRSSRTGSRLQVAMNRLRLITSEAFYERIDVDYHNRPAGCFLYRDLYWVKRKANTIHPMPSLYRTKIESH